MTRAIAAMSMVFAALLASACQPQENHAWLGYAEGDTALIAPPMAGWLTTIAVMRGSTVKAGDTLFTLDTVREAAAADSAVAGIAAVKAQIAQAEAQAAQAEALKTQAEAQIVSTGKELERQKGLVRIGGSAQRDEETAQAAYDNALASRNAAEAQRNQALAARAQGEAQEKSAEANLVTAGFNASERIVTSRVDGQVQDIFFRQGEYANAGAPVVSILPPANIYVRFFVPEPDLQKLKLGDRVHVGCDGCPANLTASIAFIASDAEFTPPIIYSVNNREKLVFKVEARAPGGLALRPGLPVDVTPAP